MKKQNLSVIHLSCREQIRLFAWLIGVVVVPWSAAGQLQPRPVWFSTNASSSVGAQAMTPDAAGNILLATSDGGDYLTIKCDANGNFLWSERYQGREKGAYGVNAIAVDSVGNVYVTGGLTGSRSYTFTFCDFFSGCHDYRVYLPDQVTVKYNGNGQRQWAATYFERGDSAFVGNAIAVDAQAAVYVAGTATIKYDAAGHQLWFRTNFVTTAMALDKAGNICLTGPGGTQKLDANGNLLWTAPLAGTVLKLDEADNIYVTGGATTTKVDANGTTGWSSALTGSALVLGAAGDVYLAGTRLVTFGTVIYATARLNRFGELLWRAVVPSYDYRSAMAVDESDNVYLNLNNNGSSYTVKYDHDGILVWQTSFNTLSLSSLALSAAGDVYVGGNGGGCVIGKYAQVTTVGAPVMTTPLQPLARPGETVTLGVNVLGDGPLSYNWRQWDSSAQSTNATLTLTNVQVAGMYTVDVANALGSVASPVIYVSLLNPLRDQTVVLGATARFTAPLTGGGPAAFQWQFNGFDIPDANSATVLVSNVGPAQAGDYTVVVSNYYGNVLTSTVARLTVDSSVTQSWFATLPQSNVGDTGQAIGVDQAGNVFVTGYSACGHKTVKYDAQGRQLWIACDGNSSPLGGLAVDRFGNVSVAGSLATTNTAVDITTFKYDPAGAQLWVARFDGLAGGNDFANAIAVDDAGNLYVAGQSIVGTNGYDFITVKYDPAGTQLWAVRYDGPTHANDIATAVAVDRDGNVCVAGVSAGVDFTYEFAVIKYAPDGRLLWTDHYNGPAQGDDVPSDIVVDGAGNIYVTGRSAGGVGHVTDFATLKYDVNGHQLWVARYNGPGGGEDNPHGLGVDVLGNVFVTGSSVGLRAPRIPFQFDIATVKYGPDGSELWVQRYNGPADGNDYSRALALDPAGNVYVEGHSDSGPHGSTEVATLSYDNGGHLLWAARYETGVETGSYYRNGSLQVDAAGNVYVADTTFFGGSPSYLTLKYTQASSGPRLTARVVTANEHFHCRLSGEAGASYTIQVSSDLKTWLSFTNLILTAAGTGEFVDAAPGVTPYRFYRALRP